MKNRNLIVMLLLTIVTFGIYGIYWEVSTKGEMNRLGAKIPTAWLLIIPIVNIWWLYKYSEGVDHVTGGKMSAVLSFILLFLLGVIGAMIVQAELNHVQSGGSISTNMPNTASQAPVTSSASDMAQATSADQTTTNSTPPQTPLVQ